MGNHWGKKRKGKGAKKKRGFLCVIASLRLCVRFLLVSISPCVPISPFAFFGELGLEPQELEAQEAQRHETFGEKSILELLRGYERMGPKVVSGELL